MKKTNELFNNRNKKKRSSEPLQILAVLILMVVGIGGSRNFLPNPVLYKNTLLLSAAIGLLSTVYYAIKVIFDPKNTKKIMSLLSLLIFPLIVTYILTASLPHLLHLLSFGENIQVISTVRNTNVHRKNCHDGFNVYEYHVFGSDSICGLMHEKHRELERFSKVQLSGVQTWWGFRVKSVELQQ